jgi:repressor LexA|nr:MAG TPA: Repressor protein CI [Caudoviricetes sp.]
MSGLGNKDIMARNIQYYMDKYEKTRQDMCNALGVKYTTFTDWVKGNSYPRIDKIELMANYFGISKADLVEDHDEYTGKPSTSKSNIVKVLGRVAAGIPLEAITDIVDEEEIPEELARTGEFFGLRISGDSMEPDIHNGDTVIVKRQDDAESDEIVIALVNGNDGVCKRLKKYADSIALISLNPNYEPMYFSQEEIEEKPVKIIGKVVELRRKF